jgi:hypothetical protein
METGYKGIPRVALSPTDESENIVILGKAKKLWEQSNPKSNGLDQEVIDILNKQKETIINQYEDAVFE